MGRVDLALLKKNKLETDGTGAGVIIPNNEIHVGLFPNKWFLNGIPTRDRLVLTELQCAHNPTRQSRLKRIWDTDQGHQSLFTFRSD